MAAVSVLVTTAAAAVAEPAAVLPPAAADKSLLVVVPQCLSVTDISGSRLDQDYRERHS